MFSHIRSRFAGHASIYILSNFAVAGVPFLLMPILTRVLTVEEYGMIAMFNVVLSLVGVGVGLNCHGAVMVRYVDREKIAIPRYVASCLVILVASSLFMLGIILLWSSYLEKITLLSVNWLIVAVLLAAMQFITTLLLVLWQASKQPVKYGTFRFSQAIFDAMLALLLVIVFTLSWQGRVASVVFVSSIMAVLSVYFLYREGWLGKTISKQYLQDALRFGVPLVPHVLGGVLLIIADRILITHKLGLESTGIYVVALQVGLIVGIAAESFNKAFTPWLLEALKMRDYARDVSIVKFTYIYFVVILSIASSIGFFSAELLLVLVGEEYQEAASIVVFMLLGNAFSGMYHMVANYIFYTSRTELLSMLSVGVGIIGLLLMWVLIQENGLLGAAQAFMIAKFLQFIGTWLIANHCHKMPWFFNNYSRIE